MQQKGTPRGAFFLRKISLLRFHEKRKQLFIPKRQATAFTFNRHACSRGSV